MTGLPLDGVRVIDLTGVWAGPFGTLLLADLGAEVIRVEPRQVFQPSGRGGSPRPTKAQIANMRLYSQYPNMEPGDRPWNRSAFTNPQIRNKLSLTLDIRRPEGRRIFERLLKLSDVLFANTVTDTVEGLKITYEDLKAIKEDIIVLHAPGMGLTGPYRNYRLHGATLEAATGFTALRGYADVHPSQNASTYVGDFAAGSQGAFAVLAALHYRNLTGRGQGIDLSQGENALHYLGPAILDYTANGRIQQPQGNHDPRAAPQGCYPCKGGDQREGFGSWVAISVFSDDQWGGLCRALGNPAWAQEERFSDSWGRGQHHDELDRLLGEWTAQHDQYAVMHLLQAQGVPAGPVLSVKDAFADPHLRDRGFFESVTQEDCGTHLYPGMLFKLSKTPLSIRTPPVRLGEHNEYVYKELLGLTAEEYVELEREGHIGMDYPPHLR
ncbi:MAG: CoA transferase [Chloroflexi bacterium]|nr:CoA transferase [Chloroflexota bacterium]